jgi:membrane-associated phospholipid phosphatase
MRYITDFADLAVLLPVALCLGAGLALLGWRRGALAWWACVGATLLGVLALKLLCLGCAAPHARGFSPSGHTAASVVILGGGLALWLRRRTGAVVAGLLAGGLVAGAVGASRVTLGMHSLAEVLLGAAIGGAGLAALLRWAGPAPDGMRGWRLVLIAAPLLLLLHGARLGAETRLRDAAGWLPRGVCAAVGG